MNVYLGLGSEGHVIFGQFEKTEGKVALKVLMVEY